MINGFSLSRIQLSTALTLPPMQQNLKDVSPPAVENSGVPTAEASVSAGLPADGPRVDETVGLEEAPFQPEAVVADKTPEDLSPTNASNMQPTVDQAAGEFFRIDWNFFFRLNCSLLHVCFLDVMLRQFSKITFQ